MAQAVAPILLNLIRMSIRIDYIPFGAKPIVRIAGRLTTTAVAQLRKACRPIASSFVMDLSDLVYADDEGINAIGEILDKGIQVQGASPFVKLLIDMRQRSKTDALDSNTYRDGPDHGMSRSPSSANADTDG